MSDNEQNSLEALRSVEASATATGHNLLRQEGLQLAPPGNLHPDQVRGCLWELIYALAAHRVCLHSTDHVSDDELYRWLYDEWLAKDAGELPTEGQWRRIDLVGSDADACNEIWLRHYADDEERRNWRQTFPEDKVPEFEPPPYDRDRWLPGPAEDIDPQAPDGPPEAADELEDLPFDELRDPLRLEEVESEIRAALPAFEPAESSPDLPLTSGEDTEEYPSVPGVTMPKGGWQCPHTELVRSGVCLPPPDEMTDEMLPSKLWELLHELACRGFYLLHTDHLSDRELYSRLWREDLRAPAILPGRSQCGGWFHDLVGAGTGEQQRLWLAYYASDAEREVHVPDNPEAPLPPKTARVVRRDYRVPKGPF